MRRPKFILVVISVWLFAAVARATPVPVPDLADLCSKSDLIVVGQIGGINRLSESNILVRDEYMRAQLMHVQMTVDLVLKGQLGSPNLVFDFVRPIEAVGYTDVPDHSYQMVFLKWDASKWEVTSPYYPSFLAVPGAQLKSIGPNTTFKVPDGRVAVANENEELVANVTRVFATALDSNLVSDNDRYRLIWVLGRVINATSSVALMRASHSSTISVKICAVGELLERGEVRVLPLGVKLLSDKSIPRDYSPGCPLQNISSGIQRGIRHPWAIPYLGKLLQLDDVDARRAAATALRRIGKQEISLKVRASVAPLLALALQDSDSEVRYFERTSAKMRISIWLIGRLGLLRTHIDSLPGSRF